MLLLLLAAVLARRPRRRFPGELALLALGSYSAARLILETFRGDAIRGLYFGGRVSFSQLVAIPCLSVAIVLYGIARSSILPTWLAPAIQRRKSRATGR